MLFQREIGREQDGGGGAHIWSTLSNTSTPLEPPCATCSMATCALSPAGPGSLGAASGFWVLHVGGPGSSPFQTHTPTGLETQFGLACDSPSPEQAVKPLLLKSCLCVFGRFRGKDGAGAWSVSQDGERPLLRSWQEFQMEPTRPSLQLSPVHVQCPGAHVQLTFPGNLDGRTDRKREPS